MAVAGRKRCEPCLQTSLENTKSDGFCEQCKEHMCRKCFSDHLKARQCRDHIFSRIHTSFDFDEGNIQKEHNRHAAGSKSMEGHEVRGMLKKYQSFDNEITELKRQIGVHREKNVSMRDKAKEGVKHFRQEILNHMDLAEKQLLQNIEENFQENERLIAALEEKAETTGIHISQICNTLSTTLHQTDFHKMNEYKSKLTKFGDDIKAIKDRNYVKTISFSPEQVFKGILEKKTSLGNISAYQSPDPRAFGFCQGALVQSFIDIEWVKGRIVQVDSRGFVTVRFTNGISKRCSAGAKGMFEVTLIDE